jgi:hypothetical protein
MNWKNFIEKTFLKASEYSGNKLPNKKMISASQLSSEPLQLFLKYKYGNTEGDTFEANTFGSIFHLGAEEAFKNIENCETEKSLQYKLKNGWLLTGTIDLILYKYSIIVDWKVTTSTAISKMHSEGKDGQYALQLGVYKFLLNKNNKVNFSTAIGAIDKNFSFFKKNKFKQLNLIEIETYSNEDIEQIAIDKTNILDEYIKKDEFPPECSNKFWFMQKDKKPKPMKCIHYCSVSKYCPYFSGISESETLEILSL